MPLNDLLSELGIVPLRAIAFQSLLLMVAIVLEAMVLRQQLRLGYRPSMQYAATLNLLATSLGWVAFLAIEAVLPLALRSQVISYVLFNRFYSNSWRESLPVVVVMVAIAAFFITYWIKLQGLVWLLQLLGQAPVETTPEAIEDNRRQRYERARRAQVEDQLGNSPQALAVLQANAASFTAILVLLLLVNRTGVVGW
ncbi:filament integrity protein FraC [Leptolyngbya sp. KIOST-1]|uniref:filament integrity protein FraC n=1 Tax=Leptolyngbya sp. KIOST-1 TaxID=1229172 RepID=UPI00068ACB44|nr:filament integrity protein FraC [Leptolyngbya sp. KIOST-1]